MTEFKDFENLNLGFRDCFGFRTLYFGFYG
jgi:hypothetical protein